MPQEGMPRNPAEQLYRQATGNVQCIIGNPDVSAMSDK
jgi:hypothetical protein